MDIAAPPALFTGPATVYKLHFLLIESDFLQAWLIRSTLESHGWEVTELHDPVEAYAKVETELFDLAIINRRYRESNLTGPSLATHFWAKQLLPSLIISGWTQNCYDRTPDDGYSVSLLSKPFTNSQLLGRIRQLLSSSFQ